MTTLSTEELVRLRECPFCGAGPAVSIQNASLSGVEVLSHHGLHFVNCGTCGIEGAKYLSQPLAISHLPDLLSELIRLRGEVEAMGWRPIETAPRDGTPILTYSEGCTETERNLVMWWSDEKAERCGFGWEAYEVSHMLAASFWMPLPAAPITGESHE